MCYNAPEPEPGKEAALKFSKLTIGLILIALTVTALGEGALTQEHSLRVSLVWSNPETPNLDLIVVDSLGAEISAETPSNDTGGQLDFDDRCDAFAQGGPENVAWPAGRAPEGEYQVKVRYTESCDEANLPTNWEVTLLVDGERTVFSGTIQPGETIPVTRFAVGPLASTLNKVVGTFPTPGQRDAPLDALVVVSFAHRMIPSAQDNVTIRSVPDGEPVDFELRWDDAARTLYLNPDGRLDSETRYRVGLGTSIVDVDGNRLALGEVVRVDRDDPGRYIFEFETEPDTRAPQVTGLFPAPNAQDVPLRPALQFRFSEPLHPNSIGSDSILLSRGEGGVAEVAVETLWDEARDFVHVIPSAALDPNTVYRVFVRASLTDLAGNPLAQGSLLERSAIDDEIIYRTRFRTAAE